jgi:hypothetical protein
MISRGGRLADAGAHDRRSRDGLEQSRVSDPRLSATREATATLRGSHAIQVGDPVADQRIEESSPERPVGEVPIPLLAQAPPRANPSQITTTGVLAGRHGSETGLQPCEIEIIRIG